MTITGVATTRRRKWNEKRVPNLAIRRPGYEQTRLSIHEQATLLIKSANTETPWVYSLAVSAQNGRRIEHRHHHLDQRDLLSKVGIREQPVQLGLGGDFVRLGHGLLIA